MAAKKKTTKKAVKSTAKKATKKVNKKAPAKRASAKKAAKKLTKKTATKKAAKKAPAKKSAKKPAKKAVKKATTKKPTKKPTKKASPKKTVKAAKKPTKKAAKKATTSGSSSKVKVIGKSVPKKVTPKTKPVKKKKAVFKMTPFVKIQHKRLLDLRDQFINAIKGISEDTLRNSNSEISANGLHQGDAGSDAYDRDYALSILAKEQDALYEIERAIFRVENGSYGICQMSGEQIPQVRLEILPFARLTVECQTLWEEKFGKKRYTIREGAEFTELM